MTDKIDYESLTVPELKDLADKRGIEILHDARKAEIIAALEASDLLLVPPGEESAEGRSWDHQLCEQQMSSTVSHELTNEQYHKLKLTA